MPSHPPELLLAAARLRITPDALATLRARAYDPTAPEPAPAVCNPAGSFPIFGGRMVYAALLCRDLDRVSYSAFVRAMNSCRARIGGAA